MSRPTAQQRADADAIHMRALSTYAEVSMAVDMLDGVTTREYARFGPDSEVASALVAVTAALVQVRCAAETRAWEAGRVAR